MKEKNLTVVPLGPVKRSLDTPVTPWQTALYTFLVQLPIIFIVIGGPVLTPYFLADWAGVLTSAFWSHALSTLLISAAASAVIAGVHYGITQSNGLPRRALIMLDEVGAQVLRGQITMEPEVQTQFLAALRLVEEAIATDVGTSGGEQAPGP